MGWLDPQSRWNARGRQAKKRISPSSSTSDDLILHPRAAAPLGGHDPQGPDLISCSGLSLHSRQISDWSAYLFTQYGCGSQDQCRSGLDWQWRCALDLPIAGPSDHDTVSQVPLHAQLGVVGQASLIDQAILGVKGVPAFQPSAVSTAKEAPA